MNFKTMEIWSYTINVQCELPFHALTQNYIKTSDFIGQFEELCVTKKSIQRLRSHTSYSSFLNKWSFPVYYQIR